MNLEYIRLNGKSDTKVTSICFHFEEISRIVKYFETESRLVVARG